MPVTESDLETCSRRASKTVVLNAFITLKYHFLSSETHFTDDVSQHKELLSLEQGWPCLLEAALWT